MNGLNVFRIVLRNCLENMENAMQYVVGCKKMAGRGGGYGGLHIFEAPVDVALRIQTLPKICNFCLFFLISNLSNFVPFDRIVTQNICPSVCLFLEWLYHTSGKERMYSCKFLCVNIGSFILPYIHNFSFFRVANT